MKRALFAREFRAALVPNLVTIVAILGTLLFVEKVFGLRLGKAEGVRAYIDVVLLAGLILSGFISGERCFPPEVKEQRLLFLSSLPISRGGAWFAIIAGRCLAALASLLVGILLRRPLFVPLKELGVSWPTLAVAAAALFIGLYMAFFAAGSLFALLLRRPLFSYIVGYPFLGLILFEILLASAYRLSSPRLQDLRLLPLWGTLDEELSTPAILLPLSLLLLLVGGCLFLSCCLFCRGEIGDIKRRMSNTLVATLAAVIFLGLVFWTSSLRLLPVRETRSPISLVPDTFPFLSLEPIVSSDGRYLCVLELIEGYPLVTRVSILENQAGRILSETNLVGFGLAQWADKGDILSLVVFNNSPLDRWGYLNPGSVDWLRLNPEGQEVSRLRLKGVEALEPLPNGRILAVLREGRVMLLHGESGQSLKVAEASLDGNVVIDRGGDSTLVYFNNIIQPDKAWVVDRGIREVAGIRTNLRQSLVFFGKVLGSSDEAQDLLRQKFSQPSEGYGQLLPGSFVLPPGNEPWIADGGLGPKAALFLEENGRTALWARTLPASWELLTVFPKLPKPPDSVIVFHPFEASLASGTVAFLAEERKEAQLFIYDLKAGRLHPVAAGCRPNERPILWMSNSLGLKGVLVTLRCKAERSSRAYTFEYLPGLSKIQPLNLPQLLHGRWGARLFISPHGWEIWLVDNDEIWRLSPQGENLRLWPPK